MFELDSQGNAQIHAKLKDSYWPKGDLFELKQGNMTVSDWKSYSKVGHQKGSIGHLPYAFRRTKGFQLERKIPPLRKRARPWCDNGINRAPFCDL